MPRSLPEGVAAFKEREEKTLEMKMKTLAVLAGVAAPLIATGSASAGFIGVKVTSKPNELGLLICNVYAIFDRPGQDFMFAVAGTPNNPLDIHVNGGTFYQHQFGTDRAPLGALVDVLFPGNGQILIGQFSTANGTAISGTMLIQYLSSGQVGTSIVSFGIPSPGALAMMGAACLIGTRRRRRHRWDRRPPKCRTP